MSRAHIGSRIINIGAVESIDNSTVFLAHYDITESEVLSGIAPISNVSTLRQYEGKFGGGIAIEEATTNILNTTKQTLTGWTQFSGSTVVVTPNQFVPEWGTNSAIRMQISGGTETLKYYTPIETSVNGGFYTAQCLIKNIGSANVKFRTQVGNTVTVSPNTIARGVCAGTGNGTSSYQFRFEASNVSDILDFYVYQPQVERRLFPTSFVETTRGDGVLTYPADMINPLEGTISFWYKPNYNTANVTTQPTSPKLLQIGSYYGNSSISIWNIVNSFTVYAKGVASSGWSVTQPFGNILTQDVWAMYTVTWSGTTWKTYKNGVLLGTSTANETLGSFQGNLMYVGGDGNGLSSNGTTANGIIDELRIDNIARTDEEILSWYLIGTPFFPRGVFTTAY